MNSPFYISLLLIVIRRARRSTLFPYTTLFRSWATRLSAGAESFRLRWIISRRRRSEEHTSELQSRGHLVCRLLLEKKKIIGYLVEVHKKHKYNDCGTSQ